MRKESDWTAAKREAKRIQRELEAALEANQTGEVLTLTALFERYEAAVVVPRVEHKTRLGKKTDELAEARRRADLRKGCRAGAPLGDMGARHRGGAGLRVGRCTDAT